MSACCRTVGLAGSTLAGTLALAATVARAALIDAALSLRFAVNLAAGTGFCRWGPPAPFTGEPPPIPEAVPVVRTLSDADIASFKALGVEVRLATEGLGDVWVVPAYTGADRQELSVDHAALIAAVASAFPGARVTALMRKPKPPVPS